MVTGLLFAMSFHSLLRKHTKAFNVVIRTKYDNLDKLIQIIIANDATLGNKFNTKLKEIGIDELGDPSNQNSIKIRNDLVQLKDSLLIELSKNEILMKHEQILLLVKHIQELDQVYYIQIATYNADIIGYNYWVKFLPTRYIFKLFKIGTKEIIS